MFKLRSRAFRGARGAGGRALTRRDTPAVYNVTPLWIALAAML